MKLRVPLHDLWWLISRASGVIALVLVTGAVALGLAMAARALRKPARKRMAMRLHEDMALIALAAIAVHGLTLLGDAWLKPGLSGIAVPFSMSYRPLFTGLGILAGYLALLLGPSFYLRRLITARGWRRLHRLTPIVWVLAATHALGSGTDGGALWLRAVVLAPLPVLAYLLIVRLFTTPPRRASPAVSAHVTVAAGNHVAGRRPAGRRRVSRQLEADGGPVSR
ncbi:MAG: ferric reductase-like transmembrane domain-containing protein [Acidobacteriota bacterium]|nr:ferric reductase-like transmembrane domain-containing protein [Acidobacteriota bacterium]